MILLTGATGLLGMHVLYDLCVAEIPVRALFREKNRISQVENLFMFYSKENGKNLFNQVVWCQGDVEDLFSLEEAFKNVTQVIHCAAMVSFKNDDFRKLVKVNRSGTANMVNMALKHGVTWFCHVSSTAAIGKGPGNVNLHLNENSKWLSDVPVSGYSMSKHLAEKEVWRGIEEGLPAVIVNPSVIFGPGNWDESSLTIFRAVKRGLKFYAPGANAFVDVRDVAERILFLMSVKVTDKRFLIVGENITFKKMTSSIAKRMGLKEPSIPVKPWFMGIAWRIAALFSFLTRKPTALTKEATESAFSITSYDTSKMDALYKKDYTKLNDSIDCVIAFEAFKNNLN